ncbi:MAG TPA: hypothetical protein VFI24_17210 [Pyrinomonadaceae bacterium]|nr:hypothetical protein [Pyrinomonadaceae bacterium]
MDLHPAVPLIEVGPSTLLQPHHSLLAVAHTETPLTHFITCSLPCTRRSNTMDQQRSGVLAALEHEAISVSGDVKNISTIE